MMHVVDSLYVRPTTFSLSIVERTGEYDWNESVRLPLGRRCLGPQIVFVIIERVECLRKDPLE